MWKSLFLGSFSRLFKEDAQAIREGILANEIEEAEHEERRRVDVAWEENGNNAVRRMAVFPAAGLAGVEAPDDDDGALRQLAIFHAAGLAGAAVRLGGRVMFFVYAHPLGPAMAELTKGFFLFPCDLGRRFGGWAQLAHEEFHNVRFGGEEQHRLWGWMKLDARKVLREEAFHLIVDAIATEDYLCMEFERPQGGLFTSTLRFNELMDVREREFDRLAGFLLRTMEWAQDERVDEWNSRQDQDY